MTAQAVNRSGSSSGAFVLRHVALSVVDNPSVHYPVRRIYCVGRNYVSHIREMKEASERDPPFFFQKPTDAIVCDGEVVPYPSLTQDFQYELELVVAIGREARNVSVSQAVDHVFGYAIGLDMTRRDFQRDVCTRGLPWEVGKAFDHSAPNGPIHETASVGHIKAGALRLKVNGDVKQQGDLNEMIWGVPEIISKLSAQNTLMPGDLIFTGTPSGVGPVEPGDVIDGTIEGLTPIRFTIGPRA